MTTELLGIIASFAVTLALAIPLGKYIAKVYKGEKTLLDFLTPLERILFRISDIDAERQMNWKQQMFALLTINVVWFVFGFTILQVQQLLPFNPDGNPNMTPDLAFNTITSFLSNTNLQHYSGESGATYFSQLGIFILMMFVSAATGMSAAAILFQALLERTTTQLGNFYNYFVKSITRVLLPLAFIMAIILSFNGTPASFDAKDKVVTMQGDTVQVSRGPAAGLISIKHIGTNGGGWFGANSAHPLENPNYLTNMVEVISQVLIPVAMVFAFGFYLNRKKLGWATFAVMSLGFVILVFPAVMSEIKGNPAITKMGINQQIGSIGSMEGKEVRFGAIAAGYWETVTTIISTGSVNSMHDSATPISGLTMMLGMMCNAFYGGVGVGMLNYFIFLIIAVFVAGLMVGRTPELLGKKVEAREMKIAMIVALWHPLMILAGAAFTSFFIMHGHGNAWLSNTGYHGFSEMLYEYSSASANNGSEFSGLNGNCPYFNITTGIVMLLSRFIPIIGPIAIAGSLASKKYSPEGAGTLKIDTFTFSVMVFLVIVIVAALSFFPALSLGPLSEHFTTY